MPAESVEVDLGRALGTIRDHAEILRRGLDRVPLTATHRRRLDASLDAIRRDAAEGAARPPMRGILDQAEGLARDLDVIALTRRQRHKLRDSVNTIKLAAAVVSRAPRPGAGPGGGRIPAE